MQTKRLRDTPDELAELKSRSGRVVRPKVYNDGTVALADQEGGDELPAARAPPPYAPSDDDEASLTDGSEGSYGSTRTRTVRSLSARPARRAAAARAPRAPATGSGAPSGYGGGGVFKQAAVEVLRAELRFMSTGEIARLALRRGLVRCNGKTPEATMASALYTDIKRKEENSIFVRPREGLFGLREWVGTNGVVQAPSGGAPFVLGAASAGPSAHHHPAAQLPPLPVHPGRHAAAAGTGAGAADPSSPGASQASGDRLMELLCAAEEINRAASAAASEDAVQAPAPDAAVKEEEADDAGTAEDAGNGHTEEDEDEEERFERQASLALASALAGGASDPAVRAAAAVAAAEAELKALEAIKGRDHPEVGRGYLSLAMLILEGTKSGAAAGPFIASPALPAAPMRILQAALRRADEVLAASASVTLAGSGSRAGGAVPPMPPPRTIYVRAHQGVPTPPELAHAPTPPALDCGRVPAPFWVAPPAPTSAALRAEHTEDVEICLPAPRVAPKSQQELPLPPPVAAV